MANKKLTFQRSHGYNGAIIRAGATVEVSEFWADRFLKEGIAIEAKSEKKAEKAVEVKQPEKTKAKTKRK